MNAEQLHDAITALPLDLVAEADKRRKTSRSSVPWQRFAAMAACFVLVLFSGVWCVRNLGMGGSQKAAQAPAAAVDSASGVEAAAEMAPAAPAAPAATQAAAEAAPMEENADFAAPETPREKENHSQTADDEGGANSACYGSEVPEVAVVGDFPPRTLTTEQRLSLSRLLSELDYLPENVCECIAEITVTVNGEDRFFINLEEGFVRCSQGQAKLTRQQTGILREILMPEA